MDKLIKIFLSRLRKKDCGVSVIEFALVAPLLLALVIGIIEFGWIFNGYITLTSAAREGARLAVVSEEDEDANIRAAIISYTPLFNLNNSNINIDRADYRGEVTTVTVSGELDLITGFFGGDNTNSIIRLPSLPGSFPLTAEVSMRQEQGSAPQEEDEPNSE